MNERIKKITNSRMFLIAIIILFMILIAATGTYAWLTWSSGENSTKLTMTIGNLADVSFTSGNNITTGLTPVFNYTDGESTTFSVKTKTSDGSSYNVKLNITSIDSELANDESVKYALVKNGELVANESLKDVTSGSSISIYNTSFEVGTTSYIFYLYIDGNMENNSNMIGKTISGKLTIELVEPTKLVDHITSLYTNYSNKVTTTNNSINYYYADIYDKDTDDQTSGGLMNDRHGSMDTEEDDGNIRYYGANPNNYIFFNCNNYNNQSITDTEGKPNCELWRIIGVFDGKVKIMRNSVFTEKLSWDQNKNNLNGTSTDTSYNNDWSNSSLQEFLNGKYYDRGEDTTYTYYNGSDGSSSVDINLESIGIKNDETRGLISESLWYLKGWSNTSIYSDQMYDYERNSGKVNITSQPTTMPGNIAIPYVSDYGYAADLGSCSGKTLAQYNDTTCTSANWMKTVYGNNYGWLMAPNSNASYNAGRVGSSGNVLNYSVYNAYGVAPVLHLNSELGIKTGDGSQDTPYQIAIG